MSEKKHDHSKKTTGKLNKLKSTPGVIAVECNLHDEAIVVSGSLTVITAHQNLTEAIAREMESAARDITASGGIIGHIKASSVVTTTKMISVTEEEAMIKDSIECKVQITLVAIVFMINKDSARDIIRRTLSAIRNQAGTKKDLS